MNTCTCCAVHNQGVHRTGDLVSPSDHLKPASTPGIVRAEAALDRAMEREAKARAEWSRLELARRAHENQLMVTWRNHPGGIKAAPAHLLAEMEGMADQSKKQLEELHRLGLETVAARARVAHENHKATQLMIANW
ncbi:hypothetical protein [Nocardioides sp.]|uniref:hypothetical protein n=1 Tax=Nocardioides sp. TaxID=35761 RepID=UPI002609A048|nr:hypothetical protein [Nocardioides sp.]MCW2736107.1 hypothetical protein [Nocardioides sp.]